MTHWCHTLINAVTVLGSGGYIVDFPEYRPDLVEEMATAIGCTHVDFRRDFLAPLKFDAHKLDLAAIDACARERANETGVILQNGEALLAAKPVSDRVNWMAAFLDRPRDHLAVLPLALFGKELPDHPRLIRLNKEELPDESFLSRMSSMRVI